MLKIEKGFTLIELLVVIGIIGILTGLTIILVSGATNNANDARRKSDISTVYKNILVKGLIDSYPVSESGFSLDNILSEHSSFFSTFLVPTDPNSSKHYYYKSNANGTDFSVLASLDDGNCFVMSSGADLFSGVSCLGFGYANAIGTSTNPGSSCKTILDGSGSVGDGVYYIDPNGGDISDRFQVYCDMTTDGGGWTLIMNKLDNFSETGWSRLTSTTGRDHLITNTQPIADNKDILVGISSTSLLMSKKSAHTSAERIVSNNLNNWSAFYSDYLGVGGYFAGSASSTSWTTKFTFTGSSAINCLKASTGDGCFIQTWNSLAVVPETGLNYISCYSTQPERWVLGDAAQNTNLNATHFKVSSGVCYNSSTTYIDPVSWQQIFVR